MRPLLSLLFSIIAESFLTQNLNFIHYNTNNSKLPHDIVYRLQQDKAGFLWISTDDGLIRFDGTEMENFDKGFISKYVIGTDEENGRIWACTWKGGIHYIKNDSAVFVRSTPDNSHTYNTNDILVFNNLVIAHAFQPYVTMLYDSVQNVLSPFSLKQNPDSNYSAWPGDREYYQFIKTSRHRLYAYNSQGVFEVVDNKLRAVNTSFRPDYIWESPQGILYYKKDNRIYLTDVDFLRSDLMYSIPVEKFRNKKPVVFRVLPSGNLCVGFESPELHNGNPVYFLINTRTGNIIDFSKEIVGEVLSADIIVDREGAIWLSTYGRGLFHIFDDKYGQIGGDKMFDNSTICSMLVGGKDSLYIGTREGLYLYHDRKTRFIRNPKHKASFSIRKLFTITGGHIGVRYAAYNLPTYSFSEGQFSELPYCETIALETYTLTLNPDCNNLITEGTGAKIRQRKLRLCSVDFVEEAGKNKLWFVAMYDLWHYEFEKGLKQFKDPQLNNILINCILFEKEKGLWLGSNKGLFLIPEHGEIMHWGVHEGLTNENIRCLFSEGKNSLWIGTQNGLFSFRNGKFTIYKRRDGLIADDVSCMTRLNDQELAIGSSKGITLFLLQQPPVEITPVLDIEKLMVNGVETDWRQPVDVTYNNSISLKYRAITFVYPELITFEYRLHDNEPWISTQNNSLVFTDLKPGDYRLELKVKKYNTNFSAPLVIDFKILSPWWRSAWFLIAVFIACVALVYFVLKYQLNQHKQKALATFELAQLKMKALQAQLNPHFISNALNTIQYFILKQDEIAANNYLGQFTDLTRLFLEVSRNRFISLETELDLLKNYLSLEKLRFEDKFDYAIDLDPSIDVSNTYIPGLLVQPFVENSINHGIVYLPKKRMGLVSISIRKSGEYIHITVNDNGIGREKAKELKKRLAKSYRSHSSQILEELKQAYNLIPGCFINIETFDKENGANGSMGTCVYIKVMISDKLN